MAITFVGMATANGNGSTSGFTASLTALTGGSDTSPSEGDIVIATQARPSGSNNLASMSVSTSGYTEIASAWADDSRDSNIKQWYKIMGATPDTAVSFSGTSSQDPRLAIALVFRGVDLTTPLDVTAETATGGDTSRPSPASITPSTSGSLIVVSCCSSFFTARTFIDPSEDNWFEQYRSETYGGSQMCFTREASGGEETFSEISTSIDDAAASWASITTALRSADGGGGGGGSSIKSVNGLAKASIKSWNGVELA